MTNPQPQPEDQRESTEAQGDEEWPEGKEYPYTPMTREDFGPGEEFIRDLFFAFRDEMDERHAEWAKRQALKQAPDADK
jgi:hypothetical protein